MTAKDDVLILWVDYGLAVWHNDFNVNFPAYSLLNRRYDDLTCDLGLTCAGTELGSYVKEDPNTGGDMGCWTPFVYMRDTYGEETAVCEDCYAWLVEFGVKDVR